MLCLWIKRWGKNYVPLIKFMFCPYFEWWNSGSFPSKNVIEIATLQHDWWKYGMVSRLGIKKTEKEQHIKKKKKKKSSTARIDMNWQFIICASNKFRIHTKMPSEPGSGQTKGDEFHSTDWQTVPCAGNTRCFQDFKSRLHKHLEEQKHSSCYLDRQHLPWDRWRVRGF